MTFELGKVLYSHLASISELTDLVGNKIYPLVIANTKVTSPYITYAKDGMTLTESKDRLNRIQTDSFMFQISADKYDQGIAICKVLDRNLNHLHGKVGDIEIADSVYVSYSEQYTAEEHYVFLLQYNFIIKNS